jgi:UDP-N-acetylmuramoylalanine--D-glutamate ligase
MVSVEFLRGKKVLIFGIGVSGLATIYKLKKYVKNLSIWDDSSSSRKITKVEVSLKFNPKFYEATYDFIVMSPGVDIYSHAHKSYFVKNFSKIITDIDIFVNSIDLKKNKIIAITGTNGKSTFCKLLQHVIKEKNNNTFLLGNYGKPALSQNHKSTNNIFILELSSYQIEYSKFLKFHSCAVLNITSDHLQRHKTFRNYINIKLKIFNALLANGVGFIEEHFLYTCYISPKNNVKKITNLKNIDIKNKFLLKKSFLPSISIIFKILKFLNVSNKIIIKKFNSFKPLPHRQEIVRKNKNICFVNDSKATNFDSAKFSLEFFNNIYWIAGGLLKKNDKLKFNFLIKKNIIKIYIVGKNTSLFKKKINNNYIYRDCKTIKKALDFAYKDARKNDFKNSTILLSPAAASFDQFKNFEERGNAFKSLVGKIKNV